MNKKLTTIEDLFKGFGFACIFKDQNGKIYGSNSAPVKINSKCWQESEFDTLLTDLFDIPEFDDVKWEDSLRYGLIEPTKENFRNDARVYVKREEGAEWRRAHLASFEPEQANRFGVWEGGKTSFTCKDDGNCIEYYYHCKFAGEEL